jgi:glycosyltransferase involved in cell wall biosynthesis
VDSTRIRELLGAAPGFLRRQAKTARQAHHGWIHTRRVGFVFGCQRSGTKMMMRVLDEAPDARIFHENHAVAFEDFQLRSDRVIRALVALTPAPVQLFKPICDSHAAADILGRFPRSRGVWIVRAPDDVANSAVKKWGDHQTDVVQAIVAGDHTTWGWRTQGVTDDTRQRLRDACAGGPLTAHEGAMLFWYVRNQAYFDQDLQHEPRMRLVRYADLAEDPTTHFPGVFHHLGAQYDASFVDQVHTSSLGKSTPPAVRPAIRALCDALMERFGTVVVPPLPLPDRLLLLIDTLGVGGAERYVVTVANRWAEQGVDVSVASSGGAQVSLLDSRVKHFEGPFDEVRASLPRASVLLHDIVQRTRPDAIVTNSLATALMARTAQAVRKVPIVNVGHGWPAERYARVARPMAVADRVVAVSPDVKNRLVAAGLEQSLIVTVHNGVDCRPFATAPDADTRAKVRAELGAPEEDHLLVVTVGRLEDQKSHQHIYTVAERLRASHPHLRFAIVGAGTRQDELTALGEQLGVSDRVRLAGRRSDIPDVLGSADLFVNCSDWEGMPLSTIEGMAAGLPVVATRTEGAAQLFTDDTGLVVPVGDLDALTAAIVALAEAPARREAMGKAARARALEHFSHARMVDQLMDVVQMVARPAPSEAHQ